MCVYIVFPSLECHEVTLERVHLHYIILLFDSVLLRENRTKIFFPQFHFLETIIVKLMYLSSTVFKIMHLSQNSE